MIASKRHLHSSIAMLGVIATLLLSFGFVSSTAYAEDLEAAQINAGDSEAAQINADGSEAAQISAGDSEAAQQADSSAAKEWDLPKGASAKKSSKRGALTTQAAPSTPASDGVVELAGASADVKASSDSYQFVLTWGELPYDLDSHMEGYDPNGQNIHVYYSHSSQYYSGDAYCTLDHDDTTSYGPETVDLKSSSRYPCYYYVHNYSGSPNMCVSGAVVKVYKGGNLVQTKKIPTKGTGLYWNICAVQNGNIIWYDDVVKKSSITSSPNLSYVSLSNKWSSTSHGKRIYPDYGHKYGNLDHFMTSNSAISSLYPNFATTAENTYPVPGLEYSSVDGGCDAAVPQGVCVTDKYIVVTAYCAGELLKEMSDWAFLSTNNYKFVKNELQKHNASGDAHNPALYVLNRSTGEYVATVEIKGIGHNHVGGIAFDGSNFWVVTSTSVDGDGNYQELKIPSTTLENSLSGGDSASIKKGNGDVQLYSLPASKSYINSASYNAYDTETDTLWVGNNKNSGSSCRVVGYKWNGSTLTWSQYYNIPSGANGMAIAYDNGHKYLLLGVSPGRGSSSTLYRWDITGRGSGFTLNKNNADGMMTLPPMLEELCVDQETGSMYSVYESGATVYGCFDGITIKKSGNGYDFTNQGRPDVSVDVICQGSVSSVLKATQSSKTNKANKTRISVACPVTVELINAEGDVVGKIYDDWVDDDYLGEDIVAWIDGDVKSFLVPSDQQFTINIIATDNGSMNVSAVQYDDEGVAESTVAYNGVTLVEEGSHNATLTTLEGDAAVSARFALADSEGEAVDPSEVVDSDVEKCQVTTVAEGDGDVSESMQVAKGDYCSVVAAPEDGAVFDGWYVGDEQVGSEREYEFWVTEDVELVAKFRTPDYVLAHVSAEGNGWIEADEPDVTVGEWVDLQAVEGEDGWFDGWYLDGKCVSTSKWYWFNAEEQDGLVAKFKPATIANVDVAAGGNGLGEVELLENDGKVGGQATVYAYAHNRAEFEGWHIGSADGALVSTDAEYTFTIEGDMQLVANFKNAPVRNATVTVKTIGSGTVTRETEQGTEVVTEFSFPIEDELTLTAVPDGRSSGSGESEDDEEDGDEEDGNVSFNGWSYNGASFGSNPEKTWTIMEDTEIIAWFSDASIKVNAVIVGDYNGEVELSRASAEVTGPGSVEFGLYYDSDENDFLGWYSNGELISENSWVYVRPTEDMMLEAHIQKASYANVTVEYDSDLGSVWKSFDDRVRVGQTVYLEAYPDYGATFDGWFIDGECVSIGDDLDYTVTGNVTIEARFSEVEYEYANVTVSYDYDLGYVWTDFDNPVCVGDFVYLEADPDYDATFDGWYINGECVSTDDELDYEVTGDVTIEARFSKRTIDISDATVSGVPTYTYDGSAKKPVPTVVLDGDTLAAGRDFTVSYKNNTNAGTATLTIAGQGDYSGTKSVDFTINKAKQSITAKAAKKSFKVSKAKAKKKALSLKKTITVKGNVGAVSYTNASTKKALKKFKVNAKNGTIKVPKGTKKGTYKIKVNVTAAATTNYASVSKPVTVKVVVK